ncbi:Uu.00g006240.m01.CDS01 [Anthostomella pinea]|uniref:Uu.00g006240.m01.CDS01 n=1 Tax=Anthostomella pinea TaxID=933095 RepID=A0AAI8YGK2_9PEZI|nr:Uu.00g006240.m01.CDS01 [Anthostomella pinea]
MMIKPGREPSGTVASKSLHSKLSEVSLYILLISLFDNIEDLQINPRFSLSLDCQVMAERMLSDPKPSIGRYSASDVLVEALRLVGVTIDFVKDGWNWWGFPIMRCERGQTFWLSLFEELDAREFGVLSIASYRGNIQLLRDTYSSVEVAQDERLAVVKGPTRPSDRITTGDNREVIYQWTHTRSHSR